jgi:hypothetical protein
VQSIRIAAVFFAFSAAAVGCSVPASPAGATHAAATASDVTNLVCVWYRNPDDDPAAYVNFSDDGGGLKAHASSPWANWDGSVTAAPMPDRPKGVVVTGDGLRVEAPDATYPWNQGNYDATLEIKGRKYTGAICENIR